MKTQRLMIALTVINLAIMVFTVSHSTLLAAGDVVPVLRGRSLEIVDSLGRVRAQIIVTKPVTMPDSQYYAESSLFRLIDPNGRPGVKIGTSVDGSAMSLSGDSERREWNGVQVLARAEGCVVKLKNKDGREQSVKP